MSFRKEVEKLINANYEYVGSDTNAINGNEMMLFKDNDGQVYAVEVYEAE